MNIGFTGTQQGLKEKQKESLYKCIQIFIDKGLEEGHHGDCVGADEQFHLILLEKKNENNNLKIIIHPPIKKVKRAFCKGFDEIRLPKDYLDRNLDIVAETDVLIACPKEYNEVMRSGTWATIRRAKWLKKPIVIIYPSGIMKMFNNDNTLN